MSSPDTNPIHVDQSFIEENKRSKLVTTRQKSGGPCSRGQRRKRRQEVFRLHFEQGIPAIKIADMMQVNRNTINDDIKWLYKEMSDKLEGPEWEGYLSKQFVRLETQHSRLLSYLAEAGDMDQKIVIEKQLADMDFRLASMMEKLKYDYVQFWEQVIKYVNRMAENEDWKYRYTSVFEKIRLPRESRKMLDEMIRKERNRDG